MKRKITVRPKKAVHASTDAINNKAIRDLVTSLRRTADIMDEMSYETFQVVKEEAGPSFYDDILDAIRILDSVR